MTTSAMHLRTDVLAWLRRYRRPLVAGAAVVGLLLLVLIDHSGSPPIVEEASGGGVAAQAVGLTTSGDQRVHANPATLHVTEDAAKLLRITVVLTSSADQPLVVTGDARLLTSGTGLVEGFASGGTVLPAHGSATLQLSGSPPYSAVGSVSIEFQATVQPAAG